MIKLYLGVLAAIIVLCFHFSVAFAQSPYVLPYPGVMPGNKLYRIYELYDLLRKYYSFGDFAQFKYNLSQSDKYLVEAKALFEYNQYPLALRALQKSDNYFKQVFPSLIKAQKNGKDITDKVLIFNSAVKKHVEVLTKARIELPNEFIWRDEKKPPLKLEIRKALDISIEVRSKNYE